ncbi:MAG: hypothetical protein QM680_12465 [Luteolibacter sp.]
MSQATFGDEKLRLPSPQSSFFNDQVVVIKIHFDSSRNSKLLTKEARISYLKNMISALNLLEIVINNIDLKIRREIFLAPESVTDLDIQKRIFEISESIRIILNEVSTPFGDPTSIENLENIDKIKIIEERLEELKKHGSWKMEPR